MSQITQLSQSPALGDLVELFELDATSLGGELYRFVPGLNGASEAEWQGHVYAAVPVEASGFEWSGQGQLPRPRLRVANVSGVFGAVAISFDDLLGAQIRRIRTFRQFLDNGEAPDPEAHYPIDVYRIDRKAAHNKIYLEFELTAALDQEGVYLPRRQVLQGYCSHRYRRWDADAGAFDYSKATCPYTGSTYFTETGAATSSPAFDKCSKKLTGCQARFGKQPLPTRQFPGVNRVR